MAKHAAPPHVFLATDNTSTQRVFAAHPSCAARVCALPPLEASSALRQTTLQEAAVDLYTCAAADGPFKGSRASSFSDTILHLRVVRCTEHPADEHRIVPATALFAAEA